MPITVFISVQGHDRLLEVDLPDNASIDTLRASVKKAGIQFEEDLAVFLDEGDEPIEWKGTKRPDHIKNLRPKSDCIRFLSTT